jgi:hypothetical protein
VLRETGAAASPPPLLAALRYLLLVHDAEGVVAAFEGDREPGPDGSLSTPALAARLAGEGYTFTIPPQTTDQQLVLSAGDVRQRVRVAAVYRPELIALEAEVTLPEYLERPGTRRQDIRGGTCAPVKGSRVTVVATASRELAAATLDGGDVAVEGAVIEAAVVNGTAFNRAPTEPILERLMQCEQVLTHVRQLAHEQGTSVALTRLLLPCWLLRLLLPLLLLQGAGPVHHRCGRSAAASC